MNLSNLFNFPVSEQRSAAHRHHEGGHTPVDSLLQSEKSVSGISVSTLSGSQTSVSISFSQTALYLSKSYGQSPFVSPPVQSEEIVADNSLSQKSADTILGFIEHYLERKVKDGATEEDSAKSLELALEGFEQGYSEAIESLGGLESLPGTVADGIVETGRLVREGIAALQNELQGNVASSENDDHEGIHSDKRDTTTAPSAKPLSEHRTTGFSDLQAVAAGYAESYRRNESVDLQVKTNDGDIITLSFSASHSRDLQEGFYSDQQSSVYAIQQRYSASSNFGLTIQGELDEGELNALNDLLSEVTELSNEFFEGDFQTAYAMALDFELDFSEFSQFSLDLALTTKAQIVETYAGGYTEGLVGNASPGNGDLFDTHSGRFDHVVKIIEQLNRLFEKAEKFDQPNQLLTELLANHLAQTNLTDQQSLSALTPLVAAD